MYPTVFQLGPIEVKSYSVMLAISFVAGVIIVSFRAKAQGIAPRNILRLSCYMVIASLVGARLAYILVHYREFIANPVEAIGIYQHGVLRLSGLVMNGGVIGSLITIWIFTTWNRLPVLKTMDAFAPALGVGIFLTRLGCFLNGCCYGRATNLPWGVVFPSNCPAGHYQRMNLDGLQPIHPTQLYSSLYGILIFVTLLVLERYKRFDGFTTLLLFMLYAPLRFAVEFFRHPSDEAGIYFGLTHNQYLSVLFIAASITGTVILSRRRLC